MYVCKDKKEANLKHVVLSEFVRSCDVDLKACVIVVILFRVSFYLYWAIAETFEGSVLSNNALYASLIAELFVYCDLFVDVLKFFTVIYCFRACFLTSFLNKRSDFGSAWRQVLLFLLGEPVSGTFRLHIGTLVSEPIPFDSVDLVPLRDIVDLQNIEVTSSGRSGFAELLVMDQHCPVLVACELRFGFELQSSTAFYTSFLHKDKMMEPILHLNVCWNCRYFLVYPFCTLYVFSVCYGLDTRLNLLFMKAHVCNSE